MAAAMKRKRATKWPQVLWNEVNATKPAVRISREVVIAFGRFTPVNVRNRCGKGNKGLHAGAGSLKSPGPGEPV